MGVGLTTLQRWRRQFAGDKDGVDGRKGSSHYVSQLVSDLADQGIYIGSERSFYRVLHAHGQLHLRADGPNQVWSWDISYLPTSVKGIWLYLYLVVDIWSRKVVA